jgi:hypothetical protein
MSTSAQPLRTHPPVLSHGDFILNRIIWSTSSSQLSHRGEQYTHHMGTPNHWGTNQLSRGERCPIHLGTTQLSHRGERCPVMWICPTLRSLSGRLNSVSEENMSWRMSHKLFSQDNKGIIIWIYIVLVFIVLSLSIKYFGNNNFW